MARPNKPLETALAAIAVLQQEVADLKAAGAGSAKPAEIEDPLRPIELPLPFGAVARDACGLARDARGAIVWTTPDRRPYAERQAEAIAQHKADGQAELAKMRDGLPPNQYRGFDGLVRDERTGKLVPEALPATYAPPGTELSPPAPKLLRPHPEQRHGHPEMENVVDDETAELLRLRRPDDPQPADPVADRVQHIPGHVAEALPDPIQVYNFTSRGAA